VVEKSRGDEDNQATGNLINKITGIKETTQTLMRTDKKTHWTARN